VTRADSLSYLFRLWPYFANKVVWAKSAGLPLAVWIGELPPRIAQTVSKECAASVEKRRSPLPADGARSKRKKQSFYAPRGDGPTELNSNHHVKMLSAYALLGKRDVDGLIFVDMDTYVARASFSDQGSLHRLLSAHAGGAVDVLFENAREPRAFWHVHGNVYYLRDSHLARKFLSEWLTWRCGFKDQYSLWHAILSLAGDAGCMPYRGEIFKRLDYENASKVNKTLDRFPHLEMSCKQRQARCPDFRFCGDEYDLSKLVFGHKSINGLNSQRLPYPSDGAAAHHLTFQIRAVDDSVPELFQMLSLDKTPADVFF